MISVVVPVYNVEQYMRESMESLIRQTRSDLEIILVDDGSADGSGEICDEYRERDSRIKVIHQENRGLSAARNAGLDICRGEMIAFLDPDDAFCSDMLARMSDAMIKHGADITECNFALYEGDRPMDPDKIRRKQKGIAPGVKREGLYQTKTALNMQIEGRIAANVWNKLYKRRIWETLRFREGQNYEDDDLILYILGEAENIYVLDDPLIMHRKRKGSITADKTVGNLRDRALAQQHYEEYIRDHIPAYFTEKELGLTRSRFYRTLLAWYFAGAFGKEKTGGRYLEELKKLITETETKTDVKASGMRTRAAAFLYHNAPFFVSRSVYRLYRSCKALVRKVTLK